MYTYKRTNLPKNTVEFAVQVPSKDITSEYELAFEELRKDLAVEGFRKGKVPKDVAQKNLSKDAVYQKMIQNYIPRIYTEIVQKEEVKPIVQPHLELVKAKENEEWELKLKTAEAPTVELGKYKEKVKAAKDKVKKADIWVPGKDKEPTEENKEKQRQAEFQAALEALLKEAKVEISDLIVEEEQEKRLSKLVDDVQKVGLSMDSYLKSKNLTQQDLTDQVRKEIEESYKLEFIIQKIADEEKIVVDDAELDHIFANIKDEKEKQMAKANAYYYAAFMRKQKALDYINSL